MPKIGFKVSSRRAVRAFSYAGKLRRLGVGRGHARTEIICLVHNQAATVVTHTGDVLAEFTIDSSKDYQRKNG